MLTVPPTGTHALIFVIDSCDKARMEEAKSELSRIIQDREMRNVVLLVFANKQDVDGGKSQTQSSQNAIANTNYIRSHATQRRSPSPRSRQNS